MDFNQVVERLISKPKYMTNGAGQLSKLFNCSKEDVYKAKKVIYGKIKLVEEPIKKMPKMSKNILIIGDTHLPYEKEGYLEFCKEQYDKFNCDTVIHIGDLIDSHATSRHPSIPDAYSAGDELEYSIKKLKEWYKVFPEVRVCIGNHDARVSRGAQDMKIASKWLKNYNEVLEVPNWEFKEYFEINDTLYVHGTGTTGMTAAYTRALNIGKNIVMGHLHSEASILHHKLPDRTIWGMIVGCGVDENSYGMNYAKNFPKKSVISCGVVLGNQPMIIAM